jgi:hypothetical protein
MYRHQKLSIRSALLPRLTDTFFVLSSHPKHHLPAPYTPFFTPCFFLLY